MRQGASSSEEDYKQYIHETSLIQGSYVYAILLVSDPKEAVGQIALMRHDIPNRVNEIGGILLGKKLQKTTAATEVYYLLLKASFEQMNSRRVEWKTNTLHAGSIKAALRLGFTFEGIFRNLLIVKGCSRDVAWYSIIESEWSAKKSKLERWLSDGNFDADGKQKRKLEDIAAEI